MSQKPICHRSFIQASLVSRTLLRFKGEKQCNIGFSWRSLRLRQARPFCRDGGGVDSVTKPARQTMSAMSSEEFEELLPDAITLSDEERQCVVDSIARSLRVVKQTHFFSWTQGMLQTVIPHEILVCFICAQPHSGMRALRFSSSRYFTEEHFTAVCEPETGVVRQMMNRWGTEHRPFLIGATTPLSGPGTDWLGLLRHHELRNAVGHGVRAADGSVKSYFCFCRVPEPFPPRLDYLLQIMAPYVDATLSRVLAGEEENVRAPAPGGGPITAREAQILRRIKEGHTNVQIAEALGISPHTVKNHVRKIMAKLGVQTRAQATVKAMQIGVLTMHND
jgi:transcriptional regulator EpsA